MIRSNDYMAAVGIGVSDLDRSAAFYIEALGMKEAQRITLDEMNEVILSHEGRTAVVLMHWTDGSTPNYRDLPIKLVFYVQDAAATVERIRALGGPITREPTPAPGLGNALVAFGKDPDGYLVELIQRPA